ncbi:HTH-type transcriptional activator RhaR [Paenibacillus allorhizoplanae]|uniref:HTH-type transcriptional activator RhaR n=1 Tax=Paenibacillus allorhizoplanae TaxID=2905648 RepID=A0ABM9CCH3_9BACL|nr:AraC family transcriptional regulator [Paenibacillus allorhizoplanae]CAH1208121.1 HTH-type transcriptional activator RhaR [Paenibacillus allorhizoplanae]
MKPTVLHFIAPPIPYFLDCGSAYYEIGESHISRTNIGAFDLIVVKKGTIFIGEGTNEWTLQPNDAIILRPDLSHFGTAPCEQEAEILWIHFHTYGAWDEYMDMDACLANQNALIEDHKQKAFLNHAEVNSIFIPKYMKLNQKALEILEYFFDLEQESRSQRNWRKQNTFQLFMQHINRELISTTDMTAFHLAEKVELFIRQNYTKKISNALLQEHLNYHPNYIAKCMLKVFGMTPNDYLLQFRIEQSKKLLIQTNWTMARVAEESGFQHASYFSHCFSTKEGISPLNFRKNYTGHS